jgi:hypothetical protein
VAAVRAVEATVVEEEVAADSLLDHWEVLELLSQPVDPEGETLYGRVLVHIMKRFDVEGLANTFKLSEGAPKQLGGELIVVEEWFLIGVLGAGSFSFSNFFRRRLSSSSSSLRPRFDCGGLLDAISPPSLGDRRFVVVNREEEEVKKKMISLWKKQGKVGRATGRGSYIDKTRNRQAPLPPPTTPLLPVRATRLRIGLRLGSKAMRRLSLMREGEGSGQ